MERPRLKIQGTNGAIITIELADIFVTNNKGTFKKDDEVCICYYESEVNENDAKPVFIDKNSAVQAIKFLMNQLFPDKINLIENQ